MRVFCVCNARAIQGYPLGGGMGTRGVMAIIYTPPPLFYSPFSNPLLTLSIAIITLRVYLESIALTP